MTQVFEKLCTIQMLGDDFSGHAQHSTTKQWHFVPTNIPEARQVGNLMTHPTNIPEAKQVGNLMTYPTNIPEAKQVGNYMSHPTTGIADLSAIFYS